MADVRSQMTGVQRHLTRAVVGLNIRLYRRSHGLFMGRVRGVSVLLLTVPGRNTGVEHTTAVSYFEHAGSYVVTGSAGGAPTEPQWFRNLRHSDRAVIELGARRVEVTVSIAGPDQRTMLWDTLVGVAPFFAGYQTKVEREMPMAVLTPRVRIHTAVRTPRV